MNAWKGRPYLQKWPKKRGPPTSAKQIAWIQRFKCFTKLFNNPDGHTRKRADELVHKSGWYYRDVLYSAASGLHIRMNGEPPITTPTVNVYRATTQTIPAGTSISISPTTKRWDNNTFWDSSINPTRLTVKSAGLYLITACVNFGSSAQATQFARFRINGGTEFAFASSPNLIGQPVDLSLQSVLYMQANDYLEIRVNSTLTNKLVSLNEFSIVGITPEVIT